MGIPKISKMHKRVKCATDPHYAAVTNDLWDEANRFYCMAKGAIVQVEGQLAESLSQLVDSPERMSKITDLAALSENVELLNRDLAAHNARLDTIHQKHMNRSGGVRNLDEANQITAINGEYATAMELYDANISPIVTSIFDQIGETDAFAADLAAMEAEKKFKELQDVSIVQDVEVKNV